MLVPESHNHTHVISMYLATSGSGGTLLGSDEKEIVYLVFGVIDVTSKEVSIYKTFSFSYLFLYRQTAIRLNKEKYSKHQVYFLSVSTCCLTGISNSTIQWNVFRIIYICINFFTQTL
jgi:hypothetical protein